MCETLEFGCWWRENRERAAEAFLRDVCAPALEAIEFGFYHWDIRAANLICDCENTEFCILDCESIVNAFNIIQVNAYSSEAAKSFGTRINPPTRAALSLCEKLLTSCILFWAEIDYKSAERIVASKLLRTI